MIIKLFDEHKWLTNIDRNKCKKSYYTHVKLCRTKNFLYICYNLTLDIKICNNVKCHTLVINIIVVLVNKIV